MKESDGIRKKQIQHGDHDDDHDAPWSFLLSIDFKTVSKAASVYPPPGKRQSASRE